MNIQSNNNTTKKIKTIHEQRRMFCIHSDRLWIAEPASQDSHTEWFIKEGWMAAKDDDFINKHVRGFVNAAKDIYFYRGLEFLVDSEDEKVFFKFLNQLCQELHIPEEAKVFGGLRMLTPGLVWPPLIEYGTIGEFKKTILNHSV